MRTGEICGWMNCGRYGPLYRQIWRTVDDRLNTQQILLWSEKKSESTRLAIHRIDGCETDHV